MPSIILLDWESTLEELNETVDFIGRNKVYEIKYPLSLVNKLHILRGTAAAKRYDNLHPNREEPQILDDLSNLNEWIVKHTYQDIKIEDPYVAAFWKHLSKEVNRWYVISQEIIPQYLFYVRKNRKKDPGAIDFITRCRNWRNSLGYNLYGLMRYITDELLLLKEKDSLEFELGAKVSKFVADLEKESFPMRIEEELLSYKKEVDNYET
jgi:hypothetical protein